MQVQLQTRPVVLLRQHMALESALDTCMCDLSELMNQHNSYQSLQIIANTLQKQLESLSLRQSFLSSNLYNVWNVKEKNRLICFLEILPSEIISKIILPGSVIKMASVSKRMTTLMKKPENMFRIGFRVQDTIFREKDLDSKIEQANAFGLVVVLNMTRCPVEELKKDQVFHALGKLTCIEKIFFHFKYLDTGHVERLFKLFAGLSDSLRVISLRENSMGRFMPSLQETIKNLPMLEELYLGYNNIQDFNVETASSLRLKKLSLCGNLFNLERSLFQLSKFLQGCTEMTVLDLALCKINGLVSSFSQFMLAVFEMSHLTHLDLSRNFVGDHGIKKMIDLSTPALQNLNLRENRITDGKQLANFISNFSTIEVLDLSENCFNFGTGEEVMESLGNLPKLQRLSLRNANLKHQVTVHGHWQWGPTVQLSNAILKHCNNLAFLDISMNSVGDLGMKTLALSLRGCRNLYHINFKNTGLGDNTIAAMHTVFCCIGCASALQKLFVCENFFTTASEENILAIICACNKLTELSLVWWKENDDRQLIQTRIKSRLCVQDQERVAFFRSWSHGT